MPENDIALAIQQLKSLISRYQVFFLRCPIAEHHRNRLSTKANTFGKGVTTHGS